MHMDAPPSPRPPPLPPGRARQAGSPARGAAGTPARSPAPAGTATAARAHACTEGEAWRCRGRGGGGARDGQSRAVPACDGHRAAPPVGQWRRQHGRVSSCLSALAGPDGFTCLAAWAVGRLVCAWQNFHLACLRARARVVARPRPSRRAPPPPPLPLPARSHLVPHDDAGRLRPGPPPPLPLLPGRTRSNDGAARGMDWADSASSRGGSRPPPSPLPPCSPSPGVAAAHPDQPVPLTPLWRRRHVARPLGRVRACTRRVCSSK